MTEGRQSKPVQAAPPDGAGGAAASLPVEVAENLIFFRARVNDSAPLWFLLDSGAEGLLLDARRARALGLNPSGGGRATGPGGDFGIAYVWGATLSFGGVSLPDQTLLVSPLSPVAEYVGRSVDGVLGYHLLSRYAVEVDYAAGVVNLYEPRAFQYTGAGERFPLAMDGGLPVVNARITLAGRGPVEARLMIDTGASSELSLGRPFVETRRLLDGARTLRSPTSTGLGGNSEARFGRAESVRLGRFELKQPVVDYVLDERGAYARAEVDGYIGGELLRRFKVIFDYTRRVMILEPNEHFAEPFTDDMSGLRLRAEGEEFKDLFVRGVVEGSPAAEAGVRAGDRLVSVDERPAASLALRQLRQMFRREGVEYLLGVGRDGRTFRVKLKTRRLI